MTRFSRVSAKRLAVAALAAGGIAMLSPLAMARDGGYGGRAGHNGGGRSYGGGHERVHVGIGLGLWGWGSPYWAGPGYWGSPYAYDPYPPAYAYPESPTVIAPVQPGPAPAASWYYCESPKGYYPYVQSCSGQWRAVPAVPAGAPTE